MEQLSNFVLGSISTLGLIGLGYSLISVLKMKKQIQKLEDLEREFDKKLDSIHRIIDEKSSYIDLQIRETINETSRRVSELNQYVDSRFDKQADKTSAVISNTNSIIVEKIDKLEEIFKTEIEQFESATINHSERLSTIETKILLAEEAIEVHQQINS